MQYLVFSFLFLVSTTVWGFSDQECLEKDVNTIIRHPAFPFGLTETILSIDKNKCVITVESEKYKYLKKKWVVDICRTPVHIKSGSQFPEVTKRFGPCPPKGGPDYCSEMIRL